MDIYKQIDKLPSNQIEREKINILKKHKEYMDFIQKITKKTDDCIKDEMNNLYKDEAFFSSLNHKLDMINNIEHIGDLRFHSLTLYLTVRLLRPEIIVETGVAAGKSTAYILKALDSNGFGHLYSFDLVPKGTKADDGSMTTLGSLPSAFLVDNSLRHRWTLTYDDSLVGLKRMSNILYDKTDIFLHDSLHTYAHTKSEFEALISIKSDKRTVFMCDNLEMGSGDFFEELTDRYETTRFTNFGVALPLWN